MINYANSLALADTAARRTIMSAKLENMDIIGWITHDASLEATHISWARDGSVRMDFMCKINPYEDRQPLIELGVETELVAVQFQDVFVLKQNIIGYYSSREVITEWELVHSSSLIAELKKQYPNISGELSHHSITCSGGTTFDIVFGEIWISEVK